MDNFMYERIKSAILDVTVLTEEEADLLALFVTGFASIKDSATRDVIRSFVINCSGEIIAYLREGALPDWVLNELAKNFKAQA